MMHAASRIGLALGVAAALAGCASMQAAKGSANTLENRVTGMEQRLSSMETSTASSLNELREELRTLTGLQQGLREQLDALARDVQQSKAAAPAEPDEK